jgi:nucleotide-binding universal stress UspA family protein
VTDTERQPPRVVVGVDRTLAGLQALRRAVAEAQARGAELHPVRSWISSRELGEEAARTVVDAFADSVGKLPQGMTLKPVVVAEAAGPALVRYACRDDDLLVLGAGRRAWWRREVSSAVVRYCVRHATCPVLVVPPPPLTRQRSPRELLRELRRELDQLSGG